MISLFSTQLQRVFPRLFLSSEKTLKKHLKEKVAVVYLCQELNDIPKEFFYPNRKKPWGTGHAVLVAREVVKENFAVINADDYYGKEAYVKMAKWLHAAIPNAL